MSAFRAARDVSGIALMRLAFAPLVPRGPGPWDRGEVGPRGPKETMGPKASLVSAIPLTSLPSGVVFVAGCGL